MKILNNRTNILVFLFSAVNLIFSHTVETQVITFINNNEFQKAIEILTSRKEQNELLLSIAYLGKNDFENAKLFALKVYEKEPKNVVVNYILALIYEEEKNYSLALFHWRRVLKYSEDKTLKSHSKERINTINLIK